jgi:alanine racemase
MDVRSSSGAPVSTVAEIHSDRLRDNLKYIRGLAGPADVLPVVKANAYGHEVQLVVPVLQAEGINQFAVATPAEGVALRRLGVDGEILVMGAVLRDAINVCGRNNLSLAVSSEEEVGMIADETRDSGPVDIHVNVDTGMGRLGVSPVDAPAVLARIEHTEGVRLRAVWSHFATADDPNSSVVEHQWRRFTRLLDRLRAGGGVPAVHVANSGALLHHRERLNLPCDMVRVGLALYGYCPDPEVCPDEQLAPVMDLWTRVVHIKDVPAGTPVSYTHSWTAPRRTRIATLAAGYGDGYRRALSNRARVRINGSLYPVVGNVCMDMVMVDLGPPGKVKGHASVAVGDSALLFGAGGPTARDLAVWADTIPYEILCGISQRVPRCMAAQD